MGILASSHIAIYTNQHGGNNKNGKVTLHSVKTCVGWGGGMEVIAPFILNLVTRWRLGVGITPVSEATEW